jgi:putative endonuclease
LSFRERGNPASFTDVVKHFAVHMLASSRNGTLYVGVTSDLVKRTWEHKQGLVEGFTKKYGTKDLVRYESHENAESALAREKQLKKWNARGRSN